MKPTHIALATSLTLAISTLASSYAMADTIPVTPENFAQAEAAWNFDNWSKLSANKEIFHYRQPTPTGNTAPTVRMNWDTLYSNRVVTVKDDHKFTITMPKTDLYISAHVIDENGTSEAYLIGEGTYEVEIDTDHAWVLFRTELTDRHSDKALAATHAVQDQIKIEGIQDDPYQPDDWNQEQLTELRTKYKLDYLAANEDLVYPDTLGQHEQERQNRSFAAGWGGMDAKIGVTNAYQSSPVIPAGECYTLTFPDPKNTYFSSVTLYDGTGYLMKGNTFISSSNWKHNKDGSVTLNFNCGDDAINNLESSEDFNYIFRSYGVSEQVLKRKINVLKPAPAK